MTTIHDIDNLLMIAAQLTAAGEMRLRDAANVDWDAPSDEEPDAEFHAKYKKNMSDKPTDEQEGERWSDHLWTEAEWKWYKNKHPGTKILPKFKNKGKGYSQDVQGQRQVSHPNIGLPAVSGLTRLVVNPESSPGLQDIRKSMQKLLTQGGFDKHKTGSLAHNSSLKKARERFVAEFNSMLTKEQRAALKHADWFTRNHKGTGKNSSAGKFSAAIGKSLGFAERDYRMIYNSTQFSEVDDKLLLGTRLLMQREQLITMMSGLVDKDGMITLYRSAGHFDSIENLEMSKTVRTSGSYIDSWTINPYLGFNGGKQGVIARIHISKLVATPIGRGIDLDGSESWPHEGSGSGGDGSSGPEAEFMMCSPLIYGISYKTKSPEAEAVADYVINGAKDEFTERTQYLSQHASAMHAVLSDMAMEKDDIERFKLLRKELNLDQTLSDKELMVAAKYSGSYDWRFYNKATSLEGTPPAVIYKEMEDMDYHVASLYIPTGFGVEENADLLFQTADTLQKVHDINPKLPFENLSVSTDIPSGHSGTYDLMNQKPNSKKSQEEKSISTTTSVFSTTNEVNKGHPVPFDQLLSTPHWSIHEVSNVVQPATDTEKKLGAQFTADEHDSLPSAFKVIDGALYNIDSGENICPDVMPGFLNLGLAGGGLKTNAFLFQDNVDGTMYLEYKAEDGDWKTVMLADSNGFRPSETTGPGKKGSAFSFKLEYPGEDKYSFFLDENGSLIGANRYSSNTSSTPIKYGSAKDFEKIGLSKDIPEGGWYKSKSMNLNEDGELKYNDDFISNNVKEFYPVSKNMVIAKGMLGGKKSLKVYGRYPDGEWKSLYVVNDAEVVDIRRGKGNSVIFGVHPSTGDGSQVFGVRIGMTMKDGFSDFGIKSVDEYQKIAKENEYSEVKSEEVPSQVSSGEYLSSIGAPAEGFSDAFNWKAYMGNIYANDELVGKGDDAVVVSGNTIMVDNVEDGSLTVYQKKTGQWSPVMQLEKDSVAWSRRYDDGVFGVAEKVPGKPDVVYGRFIDQEGNGIVKPMIADVFKNNDFHPIIPVGIEHKKSPYQEPENLPGTKDVPTPEGKAVKKAPAPIGKGSYEIGSGFDISSTGKLPSGIPPASISNISSVSSSSPSTSYKVVGKKDSYDNVDMVVYVDDELAYNASYGIELPGISVVGDNALVLTNPSFSSPLVMHKDPNTGEWEKDDAIFSMHMGMNYKDGGVSAFKSLDGLAVFEPNQGGDGFTIDPKTGDTMIVNQDEIQELKDELKEVFGDGGILNESSLPPEEDILNPYAQETKDFTEYEEIPSINKEIPESDIPVPGWLSHYSSPQGKFSFKSDNGKLYLNYLDGPPVMYAENAGIAKSAFTNMITVFGKKADGSGEYNGHEIDMDDVVDIRKGKNPGELVVAENDGKGMVNVLTFGNGGGIKGLQKMAPEEYGEYVGQSKKKQNDEEMADAYTTPEPEEDDYEYDEGELPYNVTQEGDSYYYAGKKIVVPDGMKGLLEKNVNGIFTEVMPGDSFNDDAAFIMATDDNSIILFKKNEDEYSFMFGLPGSSSPGVAFYGQKKGVVLSWTDPVDGEMELTFDGDMNLKGEGQASQAEVQPQSSEPEKSHVKEEISLDEQQGINDVIELDNSQVHTFSSSDAQQATGLFGVPFSPLKHKKTSEGSEPDYDSYVKNNGVESLFAAGFKDTDETASAAGTIVVEPDGRIWFVNPSGEYSGTKAGLPKGTVESGKSMAENAAKETMEEAGIVPEIGKVVGVVDGVKYYLARRIGGSPYSHGWETSSVNLGTLDQAGSAFNKAKYKNVIKKLKGMMGEYSTDNLYSVLAAEGPAVEDDDEFPFDEDSFIPYPGEEANYEENKAKAEEKQVKNPPVGPQGSMVQPSSGASYAKPLKVPESLKKPEPVKPSQDAKQPSGFIPKAPKKPKNYVKEQQEQGVGSTMSISENDVKSHFGPNAAMAAKVLQSSGGQYVTPATIVMLKDYVGGISGQGYEDFMDYMFENGISTSDIKDAVSGHLNEKFNETGDASYLEASEELSEMSNQGVMSLLGFLE